MRCQVQHAARVQEDDSFRGGLSGFKEMGEGLEGFAGIYGFAGNPMPGGEILAEGEQAGIGFSIAAGFIAGEPLDAVSDVVGRGEGLLFREVMQDGDGEDFGVQSGFG